MSFLKLSISDFLIIAMVIISSEVESRLEASGLTYIVILVALIKCIYETKKYKDGVEIAGILGFQLKAMEKSFGRPTSAMLMRFILSLMFLLFLGAFIYAVNS